MATIMQTTFRNVFCWMKTFEFWLKFLLSLLPRAFNFNFNSIICSRLWDIPRIVNKPVMVQITAWRRTRDRPLSESMVAFPTGATGRRRLKSPASRLFIQSFIQTLIKENIKAPRHWPLCGEFTRTGEFPAQRASYAENVSIWWRHHVESDLPRSGPR